MSYRKAFSRIILIAWNTFAVIFLLCSITLNNAQAKTLFKSRIDYSAGDNPYFVDIGDLNGDGAPDLAVTNDGSDNVSVLLGNGDGTFQTAVNYGAGDSPRSVDIGDLNGDGDLDLAVANDGSDNVSVLLGNGDGTFQSAVNYAAGDSPRSVAIGDLNGDGDPDLAVANEDSDNVSVLLGNGDGTLQIAVNYGAGDGPSSVAIGDLNGDGDPDLAVTNQGERSYPPVPGSVSVLLGNGDGTFQAAVNYDTGIWPQSVAIGDLNGDAKPDLAVANFGDLDSWGSVSVLLGNGDGTFQIAVNYGAGDGPSSIAIGDLNKDANLDLAVASPGVSAGHIVVLMGNGDGTFQSAVKHDFGDYRSVAIGDLNGDGDPDLAAANQELGGFGTKFLGSVSVLLGNGDGTFQTAKISDAGGYGSSVTIGDLNGDGNQDLTVAVPPDMGIGFIQVLLGNGDGTFQSAVNYGAGDGPSSVALGDLDGDDDLDIVTDGVFVLLGNGDGTFQSAVNYGAPGGSVALGDLDGDDDLDIVTDDVSVLLGNGDGTFQSAVNYGAPGGSVVLGDLDGDDDLDIVTDGVSVLLGNGDGTFQSAVIYAAGDNPRSVAIGDFNGDGDPDLAVANKGSDNVSVLLGNGDGTFQTALNYGAGEEPSSIVIDEFNGDDDLDLAVANGNSYNVSVLLGNGDGTFQTAVNYGARYGPTSVASGDLNGDGAPDLAVTTAFYGLGRMVAILINTGGVAKLLYTPVIPCRISDTRRAGGVIVASTQRDFHVFGDGGTISDQGGNPAGCPSPLGQPLAAHINMVAVNPTGKGNLQAFPVGAGAGAGLSVNYNTIDTNLANAGTVKTVTGSGEDITVASNFSSAHTVIDVLGYYYPNEGLYYTPVDPCRIADTRKTTAGIIDVGTERDFRVFGPVGDQGGNPAGCSSTLGVAPEGAQVNMVAVNPTGKGNLQAFPVGAGTGAGLSVNYNAIDTNLANAGTVKTSPDITVASNFSSAYTVIDVLGYYSEEEDLIYTPVKPCRIVDTRKTSAGMIDASTQRNFNVYGSAATISAQGGDPDGCPSPLDESHAVHINMIAVNPTGKGNLQAFPVGAGAGAGLSVNYNTIDTNLANAGTVKTVTGSGPDITVASNFSSAHTVIDVLGFYYPAP